MISLALKISKPKEAVPKVMSVALIELVEMTATLNVVVSINSTTVMQTYWIAPFNGLLSIKSLRYRLALKISKPKKLLSQFFLTVCYLSRACATAWLSYHLTSITSQMFFSPSSIEKNFAFSMFGTTLIVSPRRNSAFAFVFAMSC